jgi:UDP-2,3-diacylglucosamine hydrolase
VRLTRTLFISDLHLDESRPAIVAQFERFLSGVVPGADALYVLGDLFEYWAGDDSIGLAFEERVVGAMRRAAGSLPIALLHGNRDFLLAGDFARASGVELISDPSVIEIYGKRTLLMHGDTLCTDDIEYQAFRAQVREPAWQAATLARPLEERLALARGLRHQSEGAKQAKAMEIMDVAPAAVEKAFAESDCDVMIHGHTHRPGRHVHRVGGRDRVRWVLPDWYQRGGYLEASPAGIRPIEAF